MPSMPSSILASLLLLLFLTRKSVYVIFWILSLCIVNFLILKFICLRLYLIHFKKGPEYLTRGAFMVFDVISDTKCGSKKFTCSTGVHFPIFCFPPCLFNSVGFYRSIFLRWDIMYIIYIFRTIFLIFVAMFITKFRPLYALAFFRWLECRI